MRHQLRALIRAAAGRELSIMFPMVAEVAELVQARHLLDMEIAHEKGKGHVLPERIRVGTMLEVPALAFQMDSLLPLVDFVSIGSNDMAQFLFAVDRGNPRIADRYDPLSPAMLTFMRYVASKCDAAGVPLSVCGEMAGRPLEAMALLACGVRILSVSSPATGPVKTMIRSLSVGPVRDYLDHCLKLPDRSLRDRLRSFALDHHVIL